MGKKSRRQKVPKQEEPQPLHLRWDLEAMMRLPDGTALSDEDLQKLRDMKNTAKYTVDPGSLLAGPDKTRIDHLARDWLAEYTAAVAFARIRTKGLDSALRAFKRWPRLKPYWPRLRRRVCDNCASQVALSEPRYLVCGGCGVARYCCEECQRADWGWHQVFCAAMARSRRVYEATKRERGL